MAGVEPGDGRGCVQRRETRAGQEVLDLHSATAEGLQQGPGQRLAVDLRLQRSHGKARQLSHTVRSIRIFGSMGRELSGWPADAAGCSNALNAIEAFSEQPAIKTILQP